MAHTPLLRALVLAGLCAASLSAQTDTYPGAEWQKAKTPDAVGWSATQLQEAEEHASTIATAAVIIVHRGIIVHEWGDTTRAFMCHSMRKSILSFLYGIQVEEGRIDLSATLEQLGVDDNEPSLTETEKKATLQQVLQARSGVYHPALYETAAMAAARPKRGSHAPGTFWYYNNWDFNAAGTIFAQLTGRGVYEEFERRLAVPLQMQDFIRDEHTRYFTGEDSVYPAYPFQLSARDLARFGLLCVRKGRWQDMQLVSQDWVAESTMSYSDAGRSGGYGYMWWVAAEGKHFPGAEIPDGSYSARGAGGHYIVVIPEWDLVVVHRVNTFARGNRVNGAQFGELLQLILDACEDKQ
ncbi:MAG: serine hydrolase domain-containing protein [Planctomycetota bacterium]|jgi:CubicO group peptidase (beta-lactamase class C family)